jgi:hypothetical protein
MGKLEIRINNPKDETRGNLNWVHELHYCGPTKIDDEIKECCTNFYVFVERTNRSSEYFQLTRIYANREIISYEKGGEEKAYNKAKKIITGLARLIKLKLIPEELRDKTKIIEY